MRRSAPTSRRSCAYHLRKSGQNPFVALIAPLHGGMKVLFPIPKHDQEMVGYLRELIESGKFKPAIDRTYPLDQIVQAYRYVETGRRPGNAVISLEARTSGRSLRRRPRLPAFTQSRAGTSGQDGGLPARSRIKAPLLLELCRAPSVPGC